MPSHPTPTPPRRSRPALLPLAWALFRRAFWLPAAVLAFHGVLALGVGAYDWWVPLDLPMHFAGGLATAWCWGRVVGVLGDRGLVEPPDDVLWMALVFSLTTTTAVFWEFAEWSSDHLIGTASQRGLEDTLLDLAIGIGGAVVLLGVHLVRRR